MDRMEHIHGKLLDGDRVLIEDVDGYLGAHAKHNGHKSYFGYFEMPADRLKAVDQSCPYKLLLDDGRCGMVFTDILPSNKPGLMMAEFHVTGQLRRGL